MKEVFASLSVTGILRSGEIYLLSPFSNGETDPVDILYFIRTEEELREAVMMEFGVVTREDAEIRRYLGVRKIKEDCHEFKCLLCRPEDGGEFEGSFYLYRLRSLEEEKKRLMDLFSDDDCWD